MNRPQPNRLLRAARERGGLSRTALAEAVSLWLARRDPKGRDVAFDANHLGKIERGTIERPRANYIAALCAILQSTESELGFDHTSRATPDDVDRKAFLQAAFGVSAGALIARHFPEHDATDLMAAISGPTVHYRRLSSTVSTAELAPAAEAHLRLAASVVTGAIPTREGFAALSEAAMLAAWVARERDDTGTAHRRYAQAVRYAERAQQPLLTAFQLGCRGHFVAESDEPRQGLTWLQRARRELEGQAAPGTAHAFSAAVGAVAHAELGDRTAALAEMRRAEQQIDTSGDLRWPWIFPFDAPEAATYQTSMLSMLGDIPAARTAFASVTPDRVAPWRRAKATVDHARALGHAGHVDEACGLATETLMLAHRYGFERIVRRVRSLRAELPPNTREAAPLDDALASLERV